MIKMMMNNKEDNKMKYCSYLTLFSTCLFTGCASMNGYTSNPNDTPAQSILRFTGSMINAANQSITGYSVSASNQNVVETQKPIVSAATVAPSAVEVVQSDVNVASAPRLKIVKENDLETIVVPAEYTPPPAYNPNLVIVIPAKYTHPPIYDPNLVLVIQH